METKTKVFLSIAILLVLVATFYLVASAITKFTGYSITGNTIKSENLDLFAKCLTLKGVKMYGSATCPHCANQKALFGESFKYVDYIECRDNPVACADLEGVPAWDIKGNIVYGEQSLDNLAKYSGC
jgi:hypothetical protein